VNYGPWIITPFTPVNMVTIFSKELFTSVSIESEYGDEN
jgi:hypothetical protein